MSAVEERIRMLRERFNESLPDRVADIRRSWMRLSANPELPALHEEFARRLHTLGGTAGTYGLMNVAGLSVEGELACADLDGRADAETLLYLATLIEDISCAVDVWLEGPPSSPTVVAETHALQVAGR